MKPPIESKIVGYLLTHPSGISGAQMRAWLDSCRRDNGYSMHEQNDGLRALRDAGQIVCTNGTWWLKDVPSDWTERARVKTQLKLLRLVTHNESIKNQCPNLLNPKPRKPKPPCSPSSLPRKE